MSNEAHRIDPFAIAVVLFSCMAIYIIITKVSVGELLNYINETSDITSYFTKL